MAETKTIQTKDAVIAALSATMGCEVYPLRQDTENTLRKTKRQRAVTFYMAPGMGSDGNYYDPESFYGLGMPEAHISWAAYAGAANARTMLSMPAGKMGASLHRGFYVFHPNGDRCDSPTKAWVTNIPLASALMTVGFRVANYNPHQGVCLCMGNEFFPGWTLADAAKAAMQMTEEMRLAPKEPIKHCINHGKPEWHRPGEHPFHYAYVAATSYMQFARASEGKAHQLFLTHNFSSLIPAGLSPAEQDECAQFVVRGGSALK